MPIMQHTVRFNETIFFEDATGITFEYYNLSDDQLVETSISVNHADNILPPAATIIFDVEWANVPLFGNNGHYVIFRLNSSQSNYVGVGDKVFRLDDPGYLGEPIWGADLTLIENATWVTGVDVSTYGNDLNNAIIQNGDVAGTIFTIDTANSVTPNAGDLPEGTFLNANGTFGGIPLSSQGGTYQMVFIATNQFGSNSASESISLQVTIAVGTPTLNGIPDLGDVQRGATVSVIFSNYLVDDGNPNGTELILYQLDSASAIVADLSVINAITGEYSGVVSDIEVLGLKTIVAKASNGEGLSDTDTFTMNVISNVGVAPTVTGFFSGEDSCSVAGVPPTWIAGGDTFNINLSDTSSQSIDINPYIASAGTDDIDSYATVQNNLPANLVLNPATGVVEGVHGELGAFTGDSTFSATSLSGTSDDSPAFTFNIIDDSAASTPTIVSITASEGSNDVLVTFSEAVTTANGTDAEYEDGFLFIVNTTERPHSLKSGQNTNNLVFTLSDAAFTVGNKITMTYTV